MDGQVISFLYCASDVLRSLADVCSLFCLYAHSRSRIALMPPCGFSVLRAPGGAVGYGGWQAANVAWCAAHRRRAPRSCLAAARLLRALSRFPHTSASLKKRHTRIWSWQHHGIIRGALRAFGCAMDSWFAVERASTLFSQHGTTLKGGGRTHDAGA